MRSLEETRAERDWLGDEQEQKMIKVFFRSSLGWKCFTGNIEAPARPLQLVDFVGEIICPMRPTRPH
ncbi:MAG: hypothetical protein DMG27_02140, partial [Acidobacteria bacterium]